VAPPFDMSGTDVRTAPAARDFEHLRSESASLSASLSKLLADAVEALDRDQEVTRTLLRQATMLLQSATARRELTGALTPARAALAPWQAKRIASHIDSNLDRSLPLSELANVTGLSNSYFSRAFKGTFGQAPHAFILSRRLERARHEILAGQKPLSQIALSCGFADQAHLARLFRRETGQPPSEWRRRQTIGSSVRMKTTA
jgi:AraC family transcriptional regulator